MFVITVVPIFNNYSDNLLMPFMTNNELQLIPNNDS